MSDGRLIFIDETGASTKMARRYGRCRRGQRLDAALPHGHCKTTTFVGGLTSRGFIAPYVLDGAIDGQEAIDPISGRDAVSRPQRGRPDRQGLDRADARPEAAARRYRHHGQSPRPQGPRRAPGDRGQGCTTALPATLLTRPEPIERQQTFDPIPERDAVRRPRRAKTPLPSSKALLRKAAERTTEALWTTIGKLLNRFSPAECQNYIEDADRELFPIPI